MNKKMRMVCLFVICFLFNVPLLAGVERVYDDYMQMVERRRHKDITESDIVEAKRSLYMRNNYDAIIISIADLILAEKINARDLELVWWRAKDSGIRMFVLIAFYKKYGNKKVSQKPDFESLTSDFSDENRRARLKEISDVYQLLQLPQKNKCL